MKVEYRRDLSSYCLVLAAEQQPDVASYQVRMLVAIELDGFLPCRVHQMDGSLLFYYDITSRQSLEVLFQHRRVVGKELALLLESLVEALETLKNYLLCMDNLVLNARFIYTDAEKEKIWFCYLPGYGTAFGQQLREFSEFLLPRLDNQDREGVVLGYAFYQLAVKGDFTADAVRALLRGGRESLQAPGEGQGGELREEEPDRSRRNSGPDPTQAETGEAMLESFFRQEEEETPPDWKRAAVPAGAVLASVLLAAGLAWMGALPAGIGAGAALTAAVCIPYFIRKRKPEKTEEEKQTAVCDGQEEFQEEKEMEEIEEQAEAEKTVYMGPEEKRCQGALIPLAGGRNFLLDRQVILLGKSGQYADLQLPSSAVSRLHARLVWNGETYELGDLNSRNGTWVNETLLGAEQMEPLQDGDKIRFADLTYLYRK